MIFKKNKLKNENIEKIARNFSAAIANDINYDHDEFKNFISNTENLERFTNKYIVDLIESKDEKKLNDYLEKTSELNDYISNTIKKGGKVNDFFYNHFYESLKSKVSHEYSNKKDFFKKIARVSLGLGDNKNKLDIISNDKESLEVMVESAITGDMVDDSKIFFNNKYSRDLKHLGKLARNNSFYDLSMDSYEYLNNRKESEKTLKSCINEYLRKKNSNKLKQKSLNLADRYYQLSKDLDNLSKESFDFFEDVSKIGDDGMKYLDSILGEMFNDSNIETKSKIKAIHKYADICLKDREYIEKNEYLSKANNWLLTAKNNLDDTDKNKYFSKLKNKINNISTYFNSS